MKTSQLSELGGVAIEGVDLSSRPLPEEIRELNRLYDEHGLVVFRHQQLTKQQLVSAGSIFGGTQVERPAGQSDPEAPGIFVISTRGEDGKTVPRDPEEVVGNLEWHTDQGYVAAPNRGKILYSVHAPEEGGKTGFIDGQSTYDTLPDDMKARIQSLHVVQTLNRAEESRKRQLPYRPLAEREMTKARFPDTVYPVVYPHPITGAKVLHLPPLYASAILEMPGSEGEALIEELKRHILRPQFQYWHRYQVGDAVLWDNWRFLHASSGTAARYVRTLWGIALNSGPALGRVLSRNAA